MHPTNVNGRRRALRKGRRRPVPSVGMRWNAGIGDHVVMLGAMASGKSTVGRVLAERLDRPYVDNDERFVEMTGLTVAAYWREHGERAYREVELEVLLSSLAEPEPSVVSSPAGVVTSPEALDALRAVLVVWLDARPEVLAERLAGPDHRPLLDDVPLAMLRRLDDERRRTYEELADLRVDAERDPSIICEEIVAWLSERSAEATSPSRPGDR